MKKVICYVAMVSNPIQGSDVDGHKMGFLKRDPSTFEKQGNVAKTCAYLRHIVHYLLVPWLEKIASNELSGGNE